MAPIVVAIPIYKPALSPLESYSVSRSVEKLNRYPLYFFYPKGLDTSSYMQFRPTALIEFPGWYFESHSRYNQLCYEVDFYKTFTAFEHMLLLQPDAIVFRDDIEHWRGSKYDFVGAPHDTFFTYELKGFPPFQNLDFLPPVSINGCNGGLSLRRVSSMMKALSDYRYIANVLRSHGTGVGEDIFFSLVGRISDWFQVPNEYTASKFAITDRFERWIAFNGGQLPVGAHNWFKQRADFEYFRTLLSDSRLDGEMFV